MKKSEKIELFLLLGLIIIQFLSAQNAISSLVLLFTAIALGIYFNPIKIVFILQDSKDKFYRMAVSLVVSITIILAYVSLKLAGNSSLHYILFALSIINFILLCFWNKKRKTSDFYLLILNVFMFSGAIYL